MSLLSFGIYGHDWKYVDVVARLQPSTVLLFDDAWGLSESIEQASPKTLIIGRKYQPSQKRRVLAGEQLGLSLPVKPSIHAYQGWNETILVGDETLSDTKRVEYAHYSNNEFDFVRDIHGYAGPLRGIKAVALNIAPGSLWPAHLPGYFANVVREADYIGYHSYGGRRKRVGREMEPWDGDDWRRYRYQKFAQACADNALPVPKFILTEGIHEPGWKTWLNEREMTEDVINFAERVWQDKYVLGLDLYQLGYPERFPSYKDRGWDGYEMKHADYLIDAMVEWNKSHQREEEMPNEVHIEHLVPNQRDRPAGVKPKRVIVHCTRSGRDWTPAKELQATINHFKNPDSQASAHLIQAANGDWVYCVHWDKEAWGAEYLNTDSIHIEVVQAKASIPFEPIAISRLAEATKWVCGQYGIPVRRVIDENEPGIIGHEDTEQGKAHGKSDPGHMFPWVEFMRMMGGEPLPPSGDLEECRQENAELRRRLGEINKLSAL